MSSRMQELEVNNHVLTARLKELQEQLDVQALQNRFPTCRIFQFELNPFPLQGRHGKEGSGQIQMNN